MQILTTYNLNQYPFNPKTTLFNLNINFNNQFKFNLTDPAQELTLNITLYNQGGSWKKEENWQGEYLTVSIFV